MRYTTSYQVYCLVKRWHTILAIYKDQAILLSTKSVCSAIVGSRYTVFRFQQRRLAKYVGTYKLHLLCVQSCFHDGWQFFPRKDSHGKRWFRFPIQLCLIADSQPSCFAVDAKGLMWIDQVVHKFCVGSLKRKKISSGNSWILRMELNSSQFLIKFRFCSSWKQYSPPSTYLLTTRLSLPPPFCISFIFIYTFTISPDLNRWQTPEERWIHWEDFPRCWCCRCLLRTGVGCHWCPEVRFQRVPYPLWADCPVETLESERNKN